MALSTTSISPVLAATATLPKEAVIVLPAGTTISVPKRYTPNRADTVPGTLARTKSFMLVADTAFTLQDKVVLSPDTALLNTPRQGFAFRLMDEARVTVDNGAQVVAARTNNDAAIDRAMTTYAPGDAIGLPRGTRVSLPSEPTTMQWSESECSHSAHRDLDGLVSRFARREDKFEISFGTRMWFLLVASLYIGLLVFLGLGSLGLLPHIVPTKLSKDLEDDIDEAQRAFLDDFQRTMPFESPRAVDRAVNEDNADLKGPDILEGRQVVKNGLTDNWHNASRKAAVAAKTSFMTRISQWYPSIDDRNWWRQAFMTVAFVVTASFFIGWVSRSFSRHESCEFGFFQYALDMHRDAWVAETVRCWRQDFGDIMPDQLLKLLSRRVQYDSVADLVPGTPAEAFMGLMHGGKVEAGDLKIEFGRTKQRRRGMRVMRSAKKDGDRKDGQ